ncbi:MAG: PEGA domain-containing protein [Myxococcota bacterium]|nr:PEGA domain-containing protein [Myxococcota bacterium]
MSIRRLLIALTVAAVATLSVAALAHTDSAETAPQLVEATPQGGAWTMIQSNPSGATIYIKGKKHGVTPKKVQWPGGKPPTIKLEKRPNYKSIVVLKKGDRGKTKMIKLKGRVDTSPF